MTELIFTEGAQAALARLEQATSEAERLEVEAELLAGPSTDKPLQEGELEVSPEDAERLVDGIDDVDEVDGIDEGVPDGS